MNLAPPVNCCFTAGVNAVEPASPSLAAFIGEKASVKRFPVSKVRRVGQKHYDKSNESFFFFFPELLEEP